MCASLLSAYSCAQQDTATQELSLSRTRESELEEKIKVLEKARSDLEAELEKCVKQIKQMEILPSDIDQLTKVHFHIIYSSFVCLRVCMSGYMINVMFYLAFHYAMFYYSE